MCSQTFENLEVCCGHTQKILQTTDLVPGTSVRLQYALTHARTLQFTFLILLLDFHQLLWLSLFTEITQILLLSTRVCIYIVIFCLIPATREPRKTAFSKTEERQHLLLLGQSPTLQSESHQS